MEITVLFIIMGFMLVGFWEMSSVPELECMNRQNAWFGCLSVYPRESCKQCWDVKAVCITGQACLEAQLLKSFIGYLSLSYILFQNCLLYLARSFYIAMQRFRLGDCYLMLSALRC